MIKGMLNIKEFEANLLGNKTLDDEKDSKLRCINFNFKFIMAHHFVKLKRILFECETIIKYLLKYILGNIGCFHAAKQLCHFE